MGMRRPEVRASTGVIPTLFFLPNPKNTSLRANKGNRAKHYSESMIHIGRHIQTTLRQRKMTVTQFAIKLNCTRPNVYKIFAKKTIDIELLWHISQVLKHDFFADLSKELKTDTIFNTDENNKE